MAKKINSAIFQRVPESVLENWIAANAIGDLSFASLKPYYDRAAASHVIDRIARPALVIHAANDPFVRILPETRQTLLSNPNIRYVETEDGGHCAFVGQRDGNSRDGNRYDGRWAERAVVEFAKQFR